MNLQMQQLAEQLNYTTDFDYSSYGGIDNYKECYKILRMPDEEIKEWFDAITKSSELTENGKIMDIIISNHGNKLLAPEAVMYGFCYNQEDYNDDIYYMLGHYSFPS